jgi:glycosyltransferase involved in cell wall biosynthesis
LKYWLLTTEYPPDHGGGISTYCYFTAQMLASAGHDVTVFTNDDITVDFKITEAFKNIRLLRFNSNREGYHKFLGYTARLSYAFAGMVRKMIAEEGKPDLIEAQDYLGIAYYITQFKHTGYAWLSGVPILITLHSPAFIYLRYNRVPVYRFPDYWTGEMEKQAIKAADALISPTQYMLEEVKKDISFEGKPVRVIANPFQASYDTSPGFTRNKIIYYGKLSAQKGSFELLAYFRELWDKGFPHSLHIVGGTDIVYHPDMKTMGQLVKEKYGPYMVKGLLQLHGKIEPTRIQQHLQDAHLIIVPSTIDNMPYVVMEAMSLGKIVLASKQGGQAEMMEEGISGFLFDHRQPETFSEQLHKILALDDAAVQRMGANAAQYIKARYGFDQVRSQKSAFLSEFMEKTSAENEFPFLYQEETMAVAETVSAPDLLSVVIPYYNMGKYIEDCVQSVLNTTYPRIELIIINDGSTGSSNLDKLDELKTQKNITIINRPNSGLAATRNFGAEKAKGEFLAFLDADDKIAPDYYDKAVRSLKLNRNVYFAGSWVQYFENSNGAWPCFTPQPPYALVHNPVNSSGMVYKRNAFLAGGMNDKNADYGMEDYESLVSMMRNGFNGIILPELLFYYRVRSGSMFRNITPEKLLYSNAYISEKHKDFYAKFATQIINLLNANGPGYLYDNPTFETRVSIKAGGESKLFFKLKNFIKKNERLKRAALYLLKTKTDL